MGPKVSQKWVRKAGDISSDLINLLLLYVDHVIGVGNVGHRRGDKKDCWHPLRWPGMFASGVRNLVPLYVAFVVIDFNIS